MPQHYLACDLWAESGAISRNTAERFGLEEIHRFPNTPIKAEGSLHWDVPQLFHEIKRIEEGGAAQDSIASVSCDSWGVDYLLFDAVGVVVPLTFHYRTGARAVWRTPCQVKWPTIFEPGSSSWPSHPFQPLPTPERAPSRRRLCSSATASTTCFPAWPGKSRCQHQPALQSACPHGPGG